MDGQDHIDPSCNDLIVIGQDVFKKRWVMLQGKPVLPSYLQKAEQLKDAYVCFRFKQPQYNTKTSAKGYKKDVQTSTSLEYPTAKNMRPRIGLLFTNTEGKARKNFVAFMNKLSPQNKAEILQNFIRSLVPDNIDIYMDQIIKLFQVQPSYHDLYMEVLHHIIAISPERARVFIEDHFVEFIKEQTYIMPKTILDCIENIDPNGENTDNLCEYTRWKKKMKSLIVLYVHMLSSRVFGTKKDIEQLFVLLAKTCDENWNNPSAIDVYLDITLSSVQAIYKYIPKGLDIFPMLANRYRNWNSIKDTLRPSSKFKVLDILEIMDKRARKT